MKTYLRILCVVVAMAAMASVSWAGESKTKIGGTFYFDYFVNTTDGADEGDDAVRGWQLRRSYLTVKKYWGPRMETAFRTRWWGPDNSSGGKISCAWARTIRS